MKKKLFFIISFLSVIHIAVWSQGRTITGKVIDELNEPVVGATVVEENNLSNGSLTDIDGNFKLTLSNNANNVIVSYLGYQEIKFKIDSKPHYNIVMREKATELEDVVVVGYGTQKKASVVGAISQVRASDLQQASVPNLTNAIAGRVAGVITVMGSGKPGADDSKIYVRGQATTNTTSPLVLVDGLEREWQQIDPEDIQSFSVLKDASATAVYGVRGANGVILITTKRGEAGKPKLNISAQISLQQPIRLPDYLNSYGYATLMNEALINDGGAPEYTEQDLQHYLLHDSPYTHPDNDYYKDFLRTLTPQYMFSANASGGNEFMKYYISANIFHQDGLYKQFKNQEYDTNIGYNRYTFRSNLDFNITRNLTIGVDLSGRMDLRKQQNFDQDIFDKMRRLPPNWQPYINPDGSYGGRSDESRLSPYALSTLYGNRRRHKNILEGTFRIKEQMDYITPGLSIRGMVGFNSSFESKRDIKNKPELYQYDRFGNYKLNRSEENISIDTGKGPGKRRVSMEAALNYDRAFGGHAVTGLILYQQSQDYDEWKIPTGYLGWSGRATYSYLQRYLFEVNVGYNGSMQFSKDNRYGIFPAVSLGWVLSEEKFLRESPVLSYLKIRGSYGEIGNDKIGNFKYLYEQIYREVKDKQEYHWYWGEGTGSKVRGYIEGQLGNDKVTWERARKSNIGFDSKWFNNKLSLSADYFFETRTDILAIPYSIPLVLGMNRPQSDERDDYQGLPPQNIGKVRNQGFEVEIGYNGQVGKLNYFVRGNMTYARNKVIRIDEEGKKYDWQKKEGKRLGQHFGYTDIGLYQREDFELDSSGELALIGGFPVLKEGIPTPTMGVVYPGDCRYADLNGDGIINSYDIGAIGKGEVPELTYGLTIGLNWNNFDVNILFQGAGGADVYFKEDAIWEFTQQGKVMEHHLGRYNPRDPSTWQTATYPRLHASDNSNNHIKSSRWLYSRNYLRLKNVEIGYSIPKSVLSLVKINQARVYANGSNLLTFDNLNNWDPESPASDGNQYPQLRLWTMGLRINF